eukprot:2601519-Heterocapsa_arctica.AAC.1
MPRTRPPPRSRAVMRPIATARAIKAGSSPLANCAAALHHSSVVHASSSMTLTCSLVVPKASLARPLVRERALVANLRRSSCNGVGKVELPSTFRVGQLRLPAY